jgi:hypothetical protein
MMQLGRRASLLVARSLLTSAATAHAEGAWVLWSQGQDITPGEHHPADEWRVGGGFATLESK